LLVWRPDNNIQDIRNKLFPIKREKVASLKGPILPAKRKQRSLSSLVVETPRVDVKAGLKGKRTKATRRRTSYATSPDKNETMKVSPKPESQDQTIEKHTVQQSTKVVTTANKKQVNITYFHVHYCCVICF
jgi:E3 ubiquitin-protein ligase DRIP